MIDIKSQPKRMKMHPDANPELVKFARKVRKELGYWNIREIARRRHVDHRYVRENLQKGIEPPDTTPQGQLTRIQLFMPQFKCKPRPKKIATPKWMKDEARAALRLIRNTINAALQQRHIGGVNGTRW